MAPSTRTSSVSRVNRQAIRDYFLGKGVTHLHYMAPLPTMGLIAGMGIISYNSRQKVEQKPATKKLLQGAGCYTIADPNVQSRRDHKVVFGLSLHDYVPLYIGLFTPMQYVVTRNNFANQAERIVFAEVSVEKAFELEGVCYSDGNAACGATHFYNDPSGLDAIHWDIVLHENRCYTDDWKRWKMAEVLVPHVIPPECIDSYMLMDEASADRFCQAVDKGIEVGLITHTDFEILYGPSYFYSCVAGGIFPNG